MNPERISVVIPALNESELLPRCLAALMPQAREKGAEVIVVDNASTDGTAAIARELGATVVSEPRRGYVTALNAGVRAASHPLIAITDADTAAGPRWLESIESAFRNPNVVASTGPVVFDSPKPFTLLHYILRRDLWGSNMAFRRDAYERTGGFDKRLNALADVAFGRVLRAHGSIAFVRGQKVFTSGRRFQRSPFLETWRVFKNWVRLIVLGRSASCDFTNVRDTEEALRARTRHRKLAWNTAGLTALVLYFVAWPYASLFGEIVVRPRVKAKIVALTFDDGPNGAATRRIADILAEQNVTATFFEVGRNVETDPATAAYVAAKGFEIGNHAWDHSFTLPFQTARGIRRELESATSAIEEAGAGAPDLFRAPHGWRSPQLLYVTHFEHLKMVGWSIDPKDYWTDDPDCIVRRVVSHVRPGSIILLHDGLQDGPRAAALRDRRATIEALPVIIEELRAEGYEFVTVDQLLAERRQERRTVSKHRLAAIFHAADRAAGEEEFPVAF